MSGAIPPLPQYVFMAWCSVKAQGQLYLYRLPYKPMTSENFNQEPVQLSQYRLHGRGSIPVRGTNFSLNCHIQTVSGTHAACYSMGTGGGGLKNMWSYTSTLHTSSYRGD